MVFVHGRIEDVHLPVEKVKKSNRVYKDEFEVILGRYYHFRMDG